MDYRSRNISIQSQSLLEFIHHLSGGEFLIPTFQRLFVWDAASIANLWDSIYSGYPIGSILCWNTKTRLHVHRQLGGFYIPERGEPDGARQAYILDGQQRATSLLISFKGGTGRIREHVSFDFTLYFDLTRADFFFEKDYHRHRWDADSSFLVRLRDVPGLPEDHSERLSSVQGFSDAVARNLEQLRYAIAHYSIPILRLEGFDIAAVCAIYERINQTGMRLKNMDILISRGFKNLNVVVEEDFPVSPE